MSDHTIINLLNKAVSERPPMTLALGWLRYEALRKLTPHQYHAMWVRNMAGEHFDELVDELIKERE